MEKIKILVVDDESRMRKLVRDFLVREDYEVLEAGDGEAALDIFYQEKNIALIILDVMMPKMDGLSATMKIRDSKRRKVIFADGTVDTFVLRRYKCTVCGRVHLELPDIMVPHKHYSRSAIIDTINGERNCSAEQSTIYRWNREKMQLERLLVQVEDKSPEAKRTDGDNNCRCAGN